MNKIKIVCCLCLCMLAGCQKETRSSIDTVTGFLNAYKAKDQETLERYSTWKDYHVEALEMQESDYVEGVDRALQEEVFQKMMDFDFDVKEEQMKGDTGSVKVVLTVYNFDKPREEAQRIAEEKAAEVSGKEELDDQLAQQEIMRVMYEQMAKAEKNKEIEIGINVEKVKGNWLVNSNNADMQNVLLDNINMLK